MSRISSIEVCNAATSVMWVGRGGELRFQALLAVAESSSLALLPCEDSLDRDDLLDWVDAGADDAFTLVFAGI